GRRPRSLGRHRGAGVLRQVEGDDLVALLDEPLGSVAPHLPQPHHADLHGPSLSQPMVSRSPAATRRTRRPWARRLRWSPRDWAPIKVPKSKGFPGMGTTGIGLASTICTATTVSGPPLWSCPVECRKRGPYPAVVATPPRLSRTRRRSDSKAASWPKGT